MIEFRKRDAEPEVKTWSYLIDIETLNPYKDIMVPQSSAKLLVLRDAVQFYCSIQLFTTVLRRSNAPTAPAYAVPQVTLQ